MIKSDVKRFRFEYRDIPEPVFGMADGGEITDTGDGTIPTYEYRGVVGESERILGRIYDEIEARRSDSPGVFSGIVVLGVEDYLAVDAWIRCDSGRGKCIEDVVDAEIVTVPGRMIHVPRTNQRAMLYHLKEEYDE